MTLKAQAIVVSLSDEAERAQQVLGKESSMVQRQHRQSDNRDKQIVTSDQKTAFQDGTKSGKYQSNTSRIPVEYQSNLRFFLGGHNVIPDLRCNSVFFGVVMEKSLFSELKRIGIDEELASKVSASLDPEHNASKKDILIMQEAIMQIQLQGERNYQSLSSDIATLRTELHKEIADVRTEMGSSNRQYIITFLGLITTIVSVFVINWHFH